MGELELLGHVVGLVARIVDGEGPIAREQRRRERDRLVRRSDARVRERQVDTFGDAGGGEVGGVSEPDARAVEEPNAEAALGLDLVRLHDAIDDLDRGAVRVAQICLALHARTAADLVQRALDRGLVVEPFAHEGEPATMPPMTIAGMRMVG